MSDIDEDIIYPWMRLLMSAGSVEIGLHPAESWNEGVTGKRHKRKKINLAAVTMRVGGWTISGEPEAAREVFQGLSLLGFFDGMTITTYEYVNRGPGLAIYIDKPKAPELVKAGTRVVELMGCLVKGGYIPEREQHALDALKTAIAKAQA